MRDGAELECSGGLATRMRPQEQGGFQCVTPLARCVLYRGRSTTVHPPGLTAPCLQHPRATSSSHRVCLCLHPGAPDPLSLHPFLPPKGDHPLTHDHCCGPSTYPRELNAQPSWVPPPPPRPLSWGCAPTRSCVWGLSLPARLWAAVVSQYSFQSQTVPPEVTVPNRFDRVTPLPEILRWGRPG